MASGMDGLGSSSLINALDLAKPAASANPAGELKGVPVSLADPVTTQGIRKNDLVNGEAQTEPPSKTLSMRTIKKADPEIVATIKKGLANVRDAGRSALKTIKHGWGLLKRFLLKENFKPVDSGALKNVSQDAKAKLEPMREQFNQKLERLNNLKDTMLNQIDEMQAFEDRYGDSLAVMDDRSMLLNAKGEMTLPVPGDSGEVEYVQIRAPRPGNAAAREREINDFVEMFEGKQDYKKYVDADTSVADAKVERDGLKQELKGLRQDMLDEFSKDLDQRISAKHDGKKTESDEKASGTKRTLEEELNSLRQKQSEDIVDQADIASQARQKLDSLTGEERSLKLIVSQLKEKISQVKEEVSANSKSLKYARGDLKQDAESRIQAAQGELKGLEENLAQAKKGLEDIPSQRKSEHSKLHNALEAEKKLKSDPEIKKKEKELAKVDKEYSKTLKGEDKLIDKDKKDQLS